jgi:hypothetical protein
MACYFVITKSAMIGTISGELVAERQLRPALKPNLGGQNLKVMVRWKQV